MHYIDITLSHYKMLFLYKIKTKIFQETSQWKSIEITIDNTLKYYSNGLLSCSSSSINS